MPSQPQISPDQPSQASSQRNLDIDVRFLLANERTLLAWVRTALALMAGGIALTQLGRQTNAQIIAGVIIIVFGAVVLLTGYVRFYGANRSIRAGQLPNTGRAPAAVTLALIFLGLAVAAVEISRLH